MSRCPTLYFKTERNVYLKTNCRQLGKATTSCREAIGQPTPESESVAWETLLPLVGRLRSFHKFSEKMDVVVPNILRVICSVQSNEENANMR